MGVFASKQEDPDNGGQSNAAPHLRQSQRAIDLDYGKPQRTPRQREEVSCWCGEQISGAFSWWYEHVWSAPINARPRTAADTGTAAYAKVHGGGAYQANLGTGTGNGAAAATARSMHNGRHYSETARIVQLAQEKSAAQRSQSHRSERARRQPLQNSYSEGVLRDHERASVPEEFNKIYDLRSLIGVGTTAKVFLCLRRATGERLACKVIDKRRLNLEPGQQEEQLLTQLRREIDTLRSLQHPNIVKFEDVVETADMIYVVMELVSGGELFDWLLENGCMEEERAAHLMHGVVSCIAYMHSRGVVHRDLKAENLLLVDRAARWPQAKLIDFGFSTILRYNLTGSFLGTGGYIAPEIRQQRSYSQSVDMWACGVLIYLLNSRRLPFNSDVDVLPHGRHHAQMRYELKFPEVQWKGRSDSVKELLTHMLDVDPMTRWTAQQVLRHPWITGRAFTAAAAARRAPPQGAAEQPVARLLKEAPQRARRPRPHWHKDNWTPIIEDEADADAGAGRTPPQPRSPSHAQQLELQEQRMRSHSNEWVEPDVGTIWWRHHLRQGKRHHAYDPAVLHTTSAGDLLTTAKGSSRRRTRHLVPASNG